jgi:hypothetical protein
MGFVRQPNKFVVDIKIRNWLLYKFAVKKFF